MKAIIITMLFCAVFVQKGLSQNTLNVYNNTGKDIYFAYVKYENSNNGWVSNGWYTVESYQERVINLGNYKGDLYVRGEQIKLINSYWGSGYSFCINEWKSFEIRNADKVDCNKRGEFSKTRIGVGKNNWTFNP